MSARTLSYGTALFVFLLDRITKVLIEMHVSAWDTWAVIPGFFNIVNTQNRGAAFSLFASSESEWRTFFLIGLSVCALILVASLLWRPEGRLGDSRALRFGLALILGGALGNLYDRVVHGGVTDFLDVYVGTYHWPAFNVADSAITVGACLVLLDMILSRRTAQRTT
jgi:signal peptidase II